MENYRIIDIECADSWRPHPNPLPQVGEGRYRNFDLLSWEENMKKRKLGNQGLEVSALGLGCMGMSWAYGPADEAESIKVLHRALDMGINFWDTAEVYGPFKNEELLGRALKGKSRDAVILATKFGFTWSDKGSNQNEISGTDSSPAHIKKSIDGSLKRLGTDYIDLYYQHRLDPQTPIEETMQALADLVKAGKLVGSRARYHSTCPRGASDYGRTIGIFALGSWCGRKSPAHLA